MPWEIARLTDHQIIHDYILPQTALLERLERERKGLGPVADEATNPDPGPDWVPSRQMMVGVMVGMLGMSKEAANAEYDAQLRLNAERKRGL